MRLSPGISGVCVWEKTEGQSGNTKAHSTGRRGTGRKSQGKERKIKSF